MDWKPNFLKPDWQHSDPQVRRKAVQESRDPALLEHLEAILAGDEDEAVRAAAARRINSPDALLEGLARETSPMVSEACRQRITELVCLAPGGRPGVRERVELVSRHADRELLEQAVRRAREPEIRLAAVQRIEQQGLLGDVAIHDDDASVRKAAANRIEREATLVRVMEGVRKHDKALHAAIARRLHEQRLAAGDRQAVEEEALKLCVQAEAEALEHESEKPGALSAALQERWSRIEMHVSEGLSDRFQRAAERIAVARTQESASPEADQPESSEHAKATGSGNESSKDADLGSKIKSQDDSPAPPGKDRTALKDDAEKTRRKADPKPDPALIERLQSLLEQYREQLEEGSLHAALETRSTIREQLVSVGKGGARRRLDAELNRLHGRLRELRDWQHWSNDTIRKDLIKQMELLPKADLHPDALLSRIRTLQKRWKELEQSEQIPGEQHFAAAPWMWRRFRAAGNAAFEVARPYLEKRSEINEQRSNEIRELARSLMEAAKADQPDWAALRNQVRQAGQHMRGLDTLPHSARRRIAGPLGKSLKTANQRMNEYYEQVEQAKRKLIRAAEQLAFVADRDEAIAEAKRLQAEWKRAGSLWRGRENALWRAFRKPLDPLFEDLEAEHRERRKADRARLEAQKDLCRSLESLLESPDEALESVSGKVQGLVDAWSDIERPDRNTRQRFDTLHRRYNERLEAFRARTENRVRDRWWDKAAILHDLECLLLERLPDEEEKASFEQRWPKDQSEDETERLLDKRFQAALARNGTMTLDDTVLLAARQLCIRLEFLAGLPSPPEEQEMRMAYQVERLSRSMTGEQPRRSAEDESRDAERDWLTLPVLPEPEHATFSARVQAALSHIHGMNK